MGSSADPDRHFVWGIRYVDDLVLRDRDADADGSFDERLYPLQDASWNVTAVVNAVGDAQERFDYDAYGHSAALTGSFGGRESSDFDWEVRFAGYRAEIITGLHHVRFRYLHPTIGIWLSRDISDSDIDFVNLYRYTLNAPVNATDPSGLQTKVYAPGTATCT